jgi:nucleoside-diphosphate-sugar epimerase
VVCLVRPKSKTEFLEKLGVEFARGAVDDHPSLERAVKGVDAIVHSAGIVKARSEEEFREVHVTGTRALAEAAIAHAPGLKRFVHVSTAAIMGPGDPERRHKATDAENPQTTYARTKLEGERALLELKDRLPITILRPPAIYGPRDVEILAFFKMVRRTHLAIRLGSSLERVSMIYGADAAAACIRALTAAVPSGSIYFLEDGEDHSFPSMARAIAEGYGVRLLGTPNLPAPIVRVAARFSDAYGALSGRAVMFSTEKLGELLMQHFLVDAEPARRELGWSPTTRFAEGARETARWYREHGWD